MQPVRAFCFALSLAFCLAQCLTGALAAQNHCPHLRAKTVPASWTSGPSVTCSSGVDMSLGGVHVQSDRRSCPLFVIITPTHDEAEPTATPSRVVERGTLAEIVAYFKCTATYFLIFRTGDSCEFSHSAAMGQVRLLDTEMCDVPVILN